MRRRSARRGYGYGYGYKLGLHRSPISLPLAQRCSRSGWYSAMYGALAGAHEQRRAAEQEYIIM